MTELQKITPYLWFDHHAEAAADLYVSLFPNSRVISVQRIHQDRARTARSSSSNSTANE